MNRPTSGSRTAGTPNPPACIIMSSKPNADWRARQSRNLKQNPAAMKYLLERNVPESAIDHFGIGLSEPDFRRSYSGALCCLSRNLQQEFDNRYLYLAVPEVTKFSTDQPLVAWTAGESRPYFGFVGKKASTLVWFLDIFDCWSVSLVAFARPKIFADFAFACGSHGASVMPPSIQDELIEARFHRRLIASGASDNESAVAATISSQWLGTASLQVPVDSAKTWAELASKHPDRLLPELTKSGSTSPQSGWRSLFPCGNRPARLSVGLSFAKGRLYLAYKTHREVKQPDGSVLEGEVCLVITSEGRVLEVQPSKSLPGSMETILRLTDGTALQHLPSPLEGCSWSQSSVFSFLAEKNDKVVRSYPSLDELLNSLERHIRSAVWLPFEDDYALLSLVVACSYAQELFDAVPLVGLVGEKGTGKTELASTLAALGANGCLLQTFTEAAFVAAVHARRGLVVIDDLEKIAPGRGAQAAKFGNLQQLLKMSYKKATAFYKRCSGSKQEETLCTYGVKVFNNTQGIDPIIADRMFEVGTKPCPNVQNWQRSIKGKALAPAEIFTLRDELHTWAFRDASEIRRAYDNASNTKSNRAAEIMLPLQVIGELSGNTRWKDILNRVAQRRHSRSTPPLPNQLIAIAIKGLVENGYRQLSTVHVINEMLHLLRNTTADYAWLNSSNIGRIMRRDWIESSPVDRPFVQFNYRLRAYPIRADRLEALTAGMKVGATVPLVEIQKPENFCRGCANCLYSGVCIIIPENHKLKSTG